MYLADQSLPQSFRKKDRHKCSKQECSVFEGGAEIGVLCYNAVMRKDQKKIWLGFEADPIIFGILIAQIIVFTYFIVTTELIVTQKGAEVSDNNKWGFGQVLALTVVIPAGISLFTAFRTYGFRRILEHKPKQKHEQRRRHRVSHDFNNVELVRPPSRAQAPIRHYLEPRSSNLGGASSTSSTSTVEP